MVDPSRLSLNTATLKQQWGLEECIEGCARHRFAGISPWRDVLQDMGVKKAARQIRDAGLEVSGLCRGGMFTVGTMAQVLDDNRRAVDEAAQLGARCLVLVVGGIAPQSKGIHESHAIVRDALAKLLDYSRPVGVDLAIEPLHPMYAADRACVNSLSHANALCAELGAGLGVVVDVYHLWWDTALEREIAVAGTNILAFHICDWLRDTADLLLDRGMMGDGVIDIGQIRQWVEAAGYDGLYEVEIFSARNWWKRDPDEVMRTILERVRWAV
jgi:sugar phosphate isomerase/epimerase